MAFSGSGAVRGWSVAFSTHDFAQTCFAQAGFALSVVEVNGSVAVRSVRWLKVVRLCAGALSTRALDRDIMARNRNVAGPSPTLAACATRTPAESLVWRMGAGQRRPNIGTSALRVTPTQRATRGLITVKLLSGMQSTPFGQAQRCHTKCESSDEELDRRPMIRDPIAGRPSGGCSHAGPGFNGRKCHVH